MSRIGQDLNETLTIPFQHLTVSCMGSNEESKILLSFLDESNSCGSIEPTCCNWNTVCNMKTLSNEVASSYLSSISMLPSEILVDRSLILTHNNPLFMIYSQK